MSRWLLCLELLRSRAARLLPGLPARLDLTCHALTCLLLIPAFQKCSMFRVADIRKRTAIAPRILAHLYTWGPGHRTAEGEHIPVQVCARMIQCH